MVPALGAAWIGSWCVLAALTAPLTDDKKEPKFPERVNEAVTDDGTQTVRDQSAKPEATTKIVCKFGLLIDAEFGESGLRIKGVHDDSPCLQALGKDGTQYMLEEGDRITKINGKTFKNYGEYAKIMNGLKENEKVVLAVVDVRTGDVNELTVTVVKLAKK